MNNEIKKSDEGIIKESNELIIKELQTIISVSYIIAVGIGMMFLYKKYHNFEINIFDYADILDFLIAPFSDLKILVFSLSSIIFGMFIIRIDVYWKKNFPDSYSKMNFGLNKKKWFDTVRYIVYAITLLGYVHYAADIYGTETKEKIETQGKKIEIKFNDAEIKQGVLIGKTTDYIFLKTSENIVAIPIEATVKEIIIK